MISLGDFIAQFKQGQLVNLNGIQITEATLKRITSQIARFMGPTWGPPGSCRPQVGPMLTPWTLLSGICVCSQHCVCGATSTIRFWSTRRHNDYQVGVLSTINKKKPRANTNLHCHNICNLTLFVSCKVKVYKILHKFTNYLLFFVSSMQAIKWLVNHAYNHSHYTYNYRHYIHHSCWCIYKQI